MTEPSCPLPTGWKRTRLGALLHPKKEVTHPIDNPSGRAIFVGLEHLESGTGRRIGSLDVDKSQLTGRKPQFHAGDIVYGYLRPYLNKVWVAEFSGLCSVDQYVYAVDPAEADAHYVAWFMRSPVYLSRAPIAFTPGQLPRIRTEEVASVAIDLPPLAEQQRTAALLSHQMASIERARAAAKTQSSSLQCLIDAYIRHSLERGPTREIPFSAALHEVSQGIGADWVHHSVIGATRTGAAVAKEGVGKNPHRYKLVAPGTIFYNPMRVLIGSIGMVDDGEQPGITSPDYVVFNTRHGMLHPRWFFHWLRSTWGVAFIKTLARGAVRERLLFRRLAQASHPFPSWDAQLSVADKLHQVTYAQRMLKRQILRIDALLAALLRRAFAGVL